MRNPKERFKVMQGVFDNFTERTLFKLISEGYFDALKSILFIGKESNVFSSTSKEGNRIVKIYRLETCDFNRMYDCIKEDPRYAGLKGKKRKIIFSWVQREYRNLLKAREAGVNVPIPLTFKNNIIVMEFIGEDRCAPKLKDGKPKNPSKFLKDIITNMAKLYKAGLVHADLSSFNILNFNEKPVFIDFSQTTVLRNSRAEEFLDRDIRNVSNHFKKLGLKPDESKIKKQIKK